jgi:phytoene desaturase
MKKVIVIGAGFAGLSVATKLANEGYDVTVIEKNSMAGGRARVFKEQGFVFDMGPSWYWMPDIFERYFSEFGKKPSDYYNLVRLDPSYKVVFNKEEDISLPANMQKLEELTIRLHHHHIFLILERVTVGLQALIELRKLWITSKCFGIE